LWKSSRERRWPAGKLLQAQSSALQQAGRLSLFAAADDHASLTGNVVAAIFDDIGMLYNRQRRHGFDDRFSPVAFERRQVERLAGVWRTRGDSGRLQMQPASEINP